jgi:cytosine/uracil/thiamine/allantoin permease
MGAGRESRVEKDAMTVEIVFALVTGAVLAGAVFGVVVAPYWIWDLSAGTGSVLKRVGAALGGLVGVAHVVRVLRRFDRERRLGR